MASIFKTASGKWRVQIRRKGHPAISEYFSSHAEAVKYARGLEVDFDRQKRTPAGLRTTFGAVVDAYETNLKKGMGTTKAWNLSMLRDRLGHLRLEELTKTQLTVFIKKREVEGAGPSTNGQTMMYLKVVLRYGGAQTDADDAVAVALANVQTLWDAWRHTGRVSHSNERDRRPTDEELVQLMDYFDSRPRSTLPMTDIMLFAVCTAMRQGEIVGRKGIIFEDLDVTKRTLLIRKRKDPTTDGGRDQVIPLLAGHVTIANVTYDPIEIALRQKGARRMLNRVFPYSKPTIVNAWRVACQALGIDDLHFHDLRHDGVSRMFEYGYDIPQVAAVSGHKSWKNLQRYTNLRPENIKASQRSNIETANMSV